MSETTSQTETNDGPVQPEQPAEKTLTQSEVDRLLGERLAREREKFADYDDLKAKAQRLQEIEDANKTEQQKAQERIEQLSRQLAEKEQLVAQATLQSLKATVAAKKGVPASSLTGTTQEELEASADELIAWRDAAKSPARKAPNPGGLKSGASSNGDSAASPQERAAAAVRLFRGGA
ncbi:DUF4355 domain-containing protein [Nocardia farcinica]|uniref:capsid assembly scaffolding protein Gp46 family protein n=1 Tax=Nocardia farcinica TaxID=37329 RepID=UPI001893F1E4|nr:DUF4355 domain-containing protein [Nocardia farcinica]MBF6584426.1 DUF4355 domain-containing protein [Nocardia farcinica]